MKLQHIHLTVNAKISPNFSALPREDAKRFVDSLLKEINMKPLGDINWADAEDLEFPGQSFVQMITTSHCSLHFFAHKEGDNEIYFDLYSCKTFDEKKVVEMLNEKFGLVDWHGTLYTRATDEKPVVRILDGSAINREMLVAKSC
jgi:S-adenosylmethionine/arginine decarboxylase-like enzyme